MPRRPPGEDPQLTLFGDEPALPLAAQLATPLSAPASADSPALPTSAPGTAAVLALLAQWRAAGWLRALDLALPRFLHGLDAAAPPSLLLAAALLAHLEGRGHSTLPLPALADDGAALLGWPADAQAELANALAAMPADGTAARAAWAGCRLLAIDPRGDADTTPLVLAGDRLYLRRYWRHEAQVAAQVLARVDGPAHAGAGAATAGHRGADGLPMGDSASGTAATSPPPAARALMARLFPPRTDDGKDGSPDGLTDWQAVACALALRGRLTVITGGPGTGKTYTAARLLVLLQALHPGPAPLRVALAAPTGKAAARLKQSLEQALLGLPDDLRASLPAAPAAGTLHQLLGVLPDTRRFRHHRLNPLALDVLFVDEASMVHLEMMDALLDALPATTRLVLLGDRDQLASVEAGAVLADLCPATPDAYDDATRGWVQQLTGQALPPTAHAAPPEPLTAHTVLLRESRRFEGLIGDVARAVNRGDAAEAKALLTGADDNAPARLLRPADAADPARWAVQGRPGAPGLREALAGLAQRPAAPEAFTPWATALLRDFERCRVLCALREGPWGVAGLNAEITRQLAQHGLLPGTGEWYEGRPVMVTRNAPALGVFNGDIGLVLAPPAPAGLMGRMGAVGTAGTTGTTGRPSMTGSASPAAAPGLRAWFLQGATLHSVSVARLPPVETAFALTVHKSQGSEFAHVLLVLPEQDNPVLTRELLYTGITRARTALTVIAPEPARLADACARLTHRLSGLKHLLQHHQETP